MEEKKPTEEFFKEGDILVYAVHYDNCELYEDSFDDIEAIFLSWEEAVKHIEKNYPDAKKEFIQDWIWRKDVMVKQPVWTWDVIFDWDEDDGEDEEDEPYVWYSPELTIEIWNTTTGKQVPFDNEHIFYKRSGYDQTSSISTE